ncbi:MAG: hypothetical protein KOO63_00360 [Bacteroidales bacterium]|nr:hypothetical protein [Candidatus Latescibacterota bacterium]
MPDERFLMHQLKSMKIAIRVGAVLLGGLIYYRYFTTRQWDWQLILVIAVMGIVKMTALFYFKRMN